MDLVLDREYYPGGTNGTLHLEGITLAKCVEPSAAFFKQSISCIPEGIYEMELILDNSLQGILLFNCPNGIRSEKPVEVELCIRQLHRNIVPVSEITGEGQGIPSPKALENLLHRIGQALKKGEKVTLEIRSYPEHALNLTCHRIAWMD